MYQMRVQEAMLGKKVRCPRCKAVVEASRPPEPELYAEIVENEIGIAEEPRAPRSRTVQTSQPREYDEDELEELGDIRPGIPSSVVVALTAMSILLCLEVALGVLLVAVSAGRDPAELGKNLGRLVGTGVIGGLILWGLVAGHRLAWQWGRILAALAAVLGAIAMILIVINVVKEPGSAHELIVAGIVFVMTACLFAIVISLGTDAARQHFGLRCPSCKRFTSAAGDFWFNTAKCKRCNRVW
jgi:hypothetical protein